MDTFFTRLFTVILSYLHSHRLNPKRKGKKINKIRFKLLIKSRIERKRKKGDTRRKFIFLRQLLLIKKKREKKRICQRSITDGPYLYEREMDTQRKKREMETEEEEEEEQSGTEER